MPEETPALEGQPTETAPAQETAPAAKSPEDNYWRRQAEKHQRELEKIQRANMTEAEKARAERDDVARRAEALEKELQSTRVRGAFESAAARLGALDPAAAFRLADLAAVKVREDGSVEGVDQALAALKKSSPWAFSGPRNVSTGTSGGASPGPSSASPNDLINQRLRDAWRRG